MKPLNNLLCDLIYIIHINCLNSLQQSVVSAYYFSIIEDLLLHSCHIVGGCQAICGALGLILQEPLAVLTRDIAPFFSLHSRGSRNYVLLIAFFASLSLSLSFSCKMMWGNRAALRACAAQNVGNDGRQQTRGEKKEGNVTPSVKLDVYPIVCLFLQL